MLNPNFASFVKKRKFLTALVLLVIVYFAAGVAFREYRMDPKNEYYSIHLPSAARPTQIYSNPEEAVEALHADLFREPNPMERIFKPAEWFSRLIGF